MKSLCSIFYHGNYENSYRTLKLLVVFLFALWQLRKYCSHFFMVIASSFHQLSKRKCTQMVPKVFLPKWKQLYPWNAYNFDRIWYFLVIVLKLKNVIILLYQQNQSLQSLLRDFLIGKWPLNISNTGRDCLLR